MKIDSFIDSDRKSLEEIARLAYVVYDQGSPVLSAQGYLPAVPPLPAPYDQDLIVIPCCRDVNEEFQNCLSPLTTKYTVREDAFYHVGEKRDIIGFLCTFQFFEQNGTGKERIWFAFLDPAYASSENVDVELLLAVRKKV
ncbi:MAG TPA: hypothetical protein VJC21_01160 [Candidatus Nanoarchaeia archaeon]|nr:hypothetical protein [Candidatus Nanoarchaeia archaeon]